MPSQFTQRLAAAKPGFDFVAAHFACEQNLYSPSNPQGVVNFGSAQNFLHTSELNKLLAGAVHCPADMRYQAFSGTESCRTAVAQYLSDLAEATGANAPDIDPAHIILGNGIISLLEALGVALLDDGDSVLVPTPVFPGLVNALSMRVQSGVKYMHTTADTDFRVTADQLEHELGRLAAVGDDVKAVLLCSPGNPIGQVFSEQELRSMAAVAAQFNCALIVDEVYAGSCFDENAFASAVSLTDPNIYVLGGLSKDFGLAGFATGWLHTTNEPVRRAVAKQSHFFRLPAPVQTLMEHVLEPAWRRQYFAKHRAALTERFHLTKTMLTAAGIPVLSADAGLCMWLDLRQFLSTTDADGEFQLYQTLLNDHRVHVSPGTGFFTPEAGYFRICFAQDEATLAEGLRRIVAGVTQHAAKSAQAMAPA